MLSVASRIVIRVYSRSRLYLDDYFVIIAILSLCAGTGLVYAFCQSIFVIQAVKGDPSIIIPPDQYNDLAQTYAILESFLCIMWTSIFAVKLSFLALFRILIRRVSKVITRYYWIVVTTTIVTWMFLVGEPFIICPYINREQQQSL